MLAQQDGVAAIEFGILLPVLVMVLVGTMQVALLYNNFVELNNAVRVASRVLAESRDTATPWTSTTTSAYASAPNLTQASIVLTLSVAGTNCATDATCSQALTAAGAGSTASVAATYPCSLTILGVNYAPGCTLSSQTAERIE